MKHRLKLSLISTALLASLSAPIYAEESFTVDKIEIQGLKRISEGTVLNYLPIQIGQTIKPSDTAKIIRVLYKTGFFSDVTLDHQGNTLIVKVVEKPTIGQFKISGNKSIPTKVLRKTLSDLGFAEGRVYDPSLLGSIRDSLQREYYNRGNYNATVTTKVTPTSSNRVDINITVYEGPLAKISEISIIGNHAFKEKELVKQFSLSTTGMFSFLTDNDKFSQEKLNGDLETLRSFYMDRGYVQFKVDSSEVLLSPDKKKVTILIHVTEGSQFTVSGYKMAGTFVEPKEKLEKFVHFKPNEVFNRKKITNMTQAMNNTMANDGYVYAHVEPLPEVDAAKKQVFITFLVSPGNRYYVRNINFHGNDKTQDQVLRRAMRQQEGAPYSLSKSKQSETNLNRTGYFKTVKVDNTAVAGSDDEVDLDFNVTEAPSATMSMGLGYTNSLGFLVNAAYSQPNFLGSGKSVSANIQVATGEQNVSLSYFNPYYTMDGIGRGFSAYADRYDTSDTYTDSVAYQMNDYGAKMFYSFPVGEEDKLSAGIGYGATLLNTGTSASDAVINFMDNYTWTLPLQRVNEVAIDPATGLPIDYPTHESIYNVNLTSAWGHDGYDRAIFPTRGYSHSLSANVSLPGGGTSVSYYKLDYTGRIYQPLGKGFIASLRGEVGYGDGILGTQYLPFYQNFGAGGIGVSGAVRGYEAFSIGPRTMTADGDTETVGGNTMTVASFELIIPTPLTPDSFRVTTFVDAGNVYNWNGGAPAATVDGSGTGSIRYSAGVQGQWQTPMGQIIFSLAKPINPQPNDVTEVFQFSAGTSFL
ncbi:MAG: outer membrane protein [Gammaproteobacteria bacterium]|jgi:outer membrane protein insertion porin family|nr:outer membrane protein [Gammaproteobacteria bacterium]